MLKKFKAYLINKQKRLTQKAELLKLQDYYFKLKCGALFLKFIHEDIKKRKQSMNRTQRKRYEQAIKHDGQFSEEIILDYKNHIDEINESIKKELQKNDTK